MGGVAKYAGFEPKRIPNRELKRSADPRVTFLRKARIEQNRSQLDVTTEMEVTANCLSWWEGGKVSPTLHNFVSWARCLGYDVILEKIK
jgi:DNA-binding XRE family transcriptional regulator